MTNALAYYSTYEVTTTVKRFTVHAPYTTFYGRNLQMFLLATAFVPGRPLQLSLMFASKAGAYPSETRFRRSPLG